MDGPALLLEGGGGGCTYAVLDEPHSNNARFPQLLRGCTEPVCLHMGAGIEEGKA